MEKPKTRHPVPVSSLQAFPSLSIRRGRIQKGSFKKSCGQPTGGDSSSDLIRQRNLFLESVLRLPNTSDTPPFTPDDFDELSSEYRESISHFEQTVGRRVRLNDGQELLVMGNPFDEDDW